MNRNQIISAISDELSISQKDVTAVLDAQDRLIGKALNENGEVTLGKSGKIVVKESAARTGRNPQTGKSIEIPAKRSAKFKPSKDLLGAIA